MFLICNLVRFEVCNLVKPCHEKMLVLGTSLKKTKNRTTSRKTFNPPPHPLKSLIILTKNLTHWEIS